jgi:protocatechuate 3,4-dioxygenase beta subunit
MNKMLKIIFVLLVVLAPVACGPSAQSVATTAPATVAPLQPTEVATPVPTPEQASAPGLDCTDPAAPTASMTEGPYFTANSPERTTLLEPGMPGTKLVLSGYVLTTSCQPVAHALLDFWQANADGQYDNTGYTLRGHQYTDSAGRYQLTTVIPGLYPGRTEHIHVKVQAPGGPLLTTQLFFPGVASNDTDGIFDPTLLIAMQETGDGMLGTYNFILDAP